MPVIYSGVNTDNYGITDNSDHWSVEVTVTICEIIYFGSDLQTILMDVSLFFLCYVFNFLDRSCDVPVKTATVDKMKTLTTPVAAAKAGYGTWVVTTPGVAGNGAYTGAPKNNAQGRVGYFNLIIIDSSDCVICAITNLAEFKALGELQFKYLTICEIIYFGWRT